jgi:NAD(P)-dependent dehydrogenase (short-subunit alcohol dehydrogenase family)
MTRTVLITGASRGIGKAAVVHFQRRGWRVAATMRSVDKAGELRGLENVMCIPLDVLDSASIERALSAALQVFGRIDALVNNAGYAAMGPFEAATPEQIQRQYDVNVFGLMRVTRMLLPHFRENKDGVIINIASVGGRVTFPWYSLYNSTKWAVEGFSEALSHELRLCGIRVKVVEPGLIRTDFYDDSMDRIRDSRLGVYDDALNGYVKAMHKSLKYAATPQKVAKVIYRAATDRSRKLRYPAAGGARILLALRRLLPDALYLRMMGFMTMGRG